MFERNIQYLYNAITNCLTKDKKEKKNTTEMQNKKMHIWRDENT
jgi:hypothetical protein